MFLKYELQSIISGNGAVRNGKIIQAITNHLRRKKKTIQGTAKAKLIKKQETQVLIEFIEDLHDENVLTEEGSLQFIDTIFSDTVFLR